LGIVFLLSYFCENFLGIPFSVNSLLFVLYFADGAVSPFSLDWL